MQSSTFQRRSRTVKLLALALTLSLGLTYKFSLSALLAGRCSFSSSAGEPCEFRKSSPLHWVSLSEHPEIQSNIPVSKHSEKVFMRRKVTHMWCNVSVVNSTGQTLAQLSTFLGNIHSEPLLANQTLPNDDPFASSEKSSKSVANAISSPEWVQQQVVNQAHELPLIISDERPMKREEFERMRPFLYMGLGPTDIFELYHMISLVADAATAHKLTFLMYAGTLLGSARHHALMPWDSDADLLFDWAERDQLVAALEPVLASHPRYELVFFGGYHWKFRPRTTAWPFLDLFFFQRYSSNIIEPYPRVSQLASDVFPLVPRPLGPLTLPAPRLTSKVLAWRMGTRVETECRNGQGPSLPCAELQHFLPLVRRFTSTSEQPAPNDIGVTHAQIQKTKTVVGQSTSGTFIESLRLGDRELQRRTIRVPEHSTRMAQNTKQQQLLVNYTLNYQLHILSSVQISYRFILLCIIGIALLILALQSTFRFVVPSR